MADAGTETTAAPLDEEAPLNSTVTVTDAGPSRKKLAITVPAEAVDATIGDSIETVAVEAAIPGFRRGRAPKRLVEKKFGSAIVREAKNQLVARAFQEAVKGENLRVVGEPVGGNVADVEVTQGEPLAFEVEVEVQPEFDMPAIEGITIMRPGVEVSDDEVEKQLDQLRLQEGTLEERETPEPGDYVTGHGVMTGPDGTEFYNIEGCVVRVPREEDNGRGMILGVMVDDFAAQLGAPKAGDRVTIKTKGPENHEREELRGVDLAIDFAATRADRIVPATVESIVTASGFENEAQVRAAIKTRLGQRAQIRQRSLMQGQVAKHLTESAEMELPERLAAFQAERVVERRRLNMLYRGVPEQDIEQHLAELRGSSAEIAQRELKLFFILSRAADDLEVQVSEGELNARIAQMAAQREQRPEELRKELIASRRVAGVYQQVREHKTLDAIIAKATVEDVSLEEFQQRVGGEAAAEEIEAASA